MTYRLWDPADPLKITNSAEVYFREMEARDVVTPKVGYDPFPFAQQNKISARCLENEKQQKTK